MPDLTTTVPTLTLTGVAADSRLAGGAGGHPARRLIAVTVMFTGALVGALLVINVDLVLPLLIAAVVIAACALAANSLSTEGSDWAEPTSRAGRSSPQGADSAS